ncbi:DUF6443 domain-containing protein [Tenacibaculum agarivorans]|uniref:DUF6443 domain-containing protein n=1 Tax=Tenacibaculum agarivorans TaxID=1908389 RepID=UPI001F41BCA2|nr:DUF6443 domain-containing protein [Tenacibaculum agarivorans]
MKNYIFYMLSILLFLVCNSTFSQTKSIIEIEKTKDNTIQISGSNEVVINEKNTYEVINIPKDKELFIQSAEWFVSNATIISQTTKSVQIKWNSIGKQTIRYVINHRSQVFEITYDVYVSTPIAPPPSTPKIPYILSQDCKSTTLTKSLSPFNTTWYWQGTNPNGTSTSNQSFNYRVTRSGRYYLRAQNASGIWSKNSSYIDVTIGANRTWFADIDGDGLGDPNNTKIHCEQPLGYVANNRDQCPNEHGNGSSTGCPCVELTWYADTDGDGLGDPNNTKQACNQPYNYVSNSDDQCPDQNGDGSLTGCPCTKKIWYADTDDDTLGDPNNTKEACEQPLGYVDNGNDQCPTTHGGVSATGCPIPLALSNENYVYTITPQISTSSITNQTKDKDIIRSITYFDGLGRAKQNVGIKQSPTGDDIVTHTEYDEFGRQTKEYLPYTAIGNASLKSNPVTNTNNHYINNYQTDININSPNPYSEKHFENSPLNRVLQQAAPGQDWRLGSGHEIEFEYQTNTASEVKLYRVTTPLNERVYQPTLVDAGTYPAGELSKTITKDENHDGSNTKLHTTEEFKNKQGQVVLKRTYASINSATSGVSSVEPHDTYYVYDDFGNLTYVLPPKVVTTDGISNSELNELCYQYIYDYRNRLARKKIPGKDWEYIIYNRLDQPIITQDGNLRANTRWLFTKYDDFGRVIYTGEWSNTQSVTAIQGHANNPFYKNTEERSTANTIANTQLYYTNVALPLSAIEQIFTINYYDTYVDLPADLQPTVTTSYGLQSTTKTKGLATVSKTRVLETDDWITTVTYYDEKGRPIYIYSKNEYLNTTDIIEHKLDFVGKILEKKTTHQKDGQAEIVTLDLFTYDHIGRLLTQKQQINNQSEETIVSNEYDDLGLLKSKKVGGNLQQVDYTYNIRGWLTNINEDAVDDNDLFNFKIRYNNPTTGKALYNGNISQTSWNTASINTTNNPVLSEYTYTYDALNRITGATGKETTNYNIQGITYDKNGNILTLQRNGHLNSDSSTFGVMDNLVYHYDTGNKLTKVLDHGNDDFGFKDGINSNEEYTYDVNGNMKTDGNKNISNIIYNHLNLPKQVTIGGKNIVYTYDALGVKQRKEVNGVVTDYAGNYIYENEKLQFFNHEEGYIKPNVTSNGVEMDYIYQYKDHLGNVRLSYTDRDGDYQNIVSSSFSNHMEGWLKGNVETEINNGRVKVTVNRQWEGIRHNLSDIAVQPGDKFTVRCTFDKGNTNAKVRFYVRERDSNGNHILYTGLDYDLQTGSYTFPYTVQAGHKISLHIDKDNTYTNETTHFYVDEVTFSKGKLTIIEESNYYPFGLKHKGYHTLVSPAGNSLAQKFGYNGKELNEELGIEWHDFGARNYDASLGRWMNLDPLAEEMTTHSPYNYVFNNPMYFIDPDGMAPWVPTVNEDSSVTYTAEEGDSAKTLASQYGLEIEDAEAITGTRSDTEIKSGTKISGEKVKNVTGNEVLKLDLNSKEGKNSQKRFDQYLFARDYSNSEGASSFLSTDYFSNTKYKSIITGRAIMDIDGESVGVLYNIPLYRAATFDGSSTATILSNSPIRTKPTSGISFSNQANVELPLYHPNTRAQMGSYTIFINGKNSDKVMKRLNKKLPRRLKRKD